jgi:hypothetical protein
MTCNLKALGLMLVAALAVGATLAPAAQAQAEFKAESYPTTATSQSEATWGFGGPLDFYCADAHWQHEMAGASKTATVTMAYSNCTFGGTVTMNGCKYVFTAGVQFLVDRFTGTMDISCPGANKIVIVAGTCEVQIGNQTNRKELQSVDETEASPKKLIETQVAVEKAKYNVTKDGALCPLPGLGEKEDGEYSSIATLTGDDGKGNPVGIWIEE